MISAISCENAHQFGPALHSQFVLRHAGFIERQQYDVSVFNNMEFDQYDTPATTYLVYHTEDGRALGCCRLFPTTVGCMLKDLWPEFVENKDNLCSPAIWEGTRYCVDKDVTPALRQTIINEIACAYLEFGFAMGLKKIIGLMPTFIYRSVFEKPGIVMEYLGPIQKIGRHRCRAVAVPIEMEHLLNVRKITGIRGSVLRFSSDEKERVNARAA